MKKLYYLKHQFDDTYVLETDWGFIYVDDRQEATVYESIEDIEKTVNNYDLEVEIITIYIGKNV